MHPAIEAILEVDMQPYLKEQQKRKVAKRKKKQMKRKKRQAVVLTIAGVTGKVIRDFIND